MHQGLPEPSFSMIAPIIEKDGIKKQTNIIGLYRICEEPNCQTYISCPFVRCLEHWYALSSKVGTAMKEYK